MEISMKEEEMKALIEPVTERKWEEVVAKEDEKRKETEKAEKRVKKNVGAKTEKLAEKLKRFKVKLKQIKKEKERERRWNMNALGFSTTEYKKMGYVEAAKWIANPIAIALNEKINSEKYKCKMEILNLARGEDPIGARTCARYNRGEHCFGNWHTSQQNNSDFQELRLHGCTLCCETFGTIIGHPVVNCPWTLERTWIQIEES